MILRTILLNDYTLPGEYSNAPVYIAYQLVNLDNDPIIGYSEELGGLVGIAGETLQLISSEDKIELPVNTLISPASKWQFRLLHQNIEFNNISVGLDNGDDLTIPELFTLDSTSEYWDIYESRLLPNPATAAIGSIPVVNADNEWEISTDPIGSGDMQKLIYDPANIAGNVYDLSNKVGNLDAGVFT